MFNNKDWYKNINYVWVSLGIYVLILFIFLFNLNLYYSSGIQAKQSIIREGLLLPQVNGVDTLLNVDPLLSSSKNEASINIRKKVSSLIFSSLFRENVEGGLDSDLVDSYSFLEAKELNLKLKDGVYWSDGRQLTASDVEFTINIIRSLGQETIYSGAANGNDIQISVISPTELKISLQNQTSARPNASYLYELTFPVLPKHVLEGYTKPDFNVLPVTDFGKSPVTSGFFKYDQNRIDELTLTYNDKYYGQKAAVSAYVLKFYRSYSDIINAFKLRNIDLFVREDNVRDEVHNFLLFENVNTAEPITRNRKLALYFNLASKSDSATIFNTLVTPRRALLHAVSRNKIYEQVGLPLREIYGPIDHKSWAFSEDVLERNSYKPEELSKVLNLLDYVKVDGFYTKENKKLILKVSYLKSDFNDKILVSFKNQMESLGLAVQLEGLEASSDTGSIKQNSFSAIVNNRDYDVLLTYVDKNLDPDIFSEWHSSRSTPPGINFSSFNSRVADRTLSDAKILSKIEDRKTQYSRFQKAFYDESAPALFLFNPSIIIYYRKDTSLDIPREINSSNSIYNKVSNWTVN